MDRDAALEDIFDQAGVPIRVANCGPADRVSTRVHYWKFGANDLFVAHGEGLRLTRTQSQLRAAAPEAIRVGFQVSGRYTLSVTGHDEMQGAGHVNFTDLTVPCEFTQYGASASTASFQLSYDQLRFPVEKGPQGGPDAGEQPGLCSRAGSHGGICAGVRRTGLQRVGRDDRRRDPRAGAGDDLERGPADDARSNSVMNETLYTRIVAFIQQNLADPGLSPERIAWQHHISVGSSTSSGCTTNSASPSGS